MNDRENEVEELRITMPKSQYDYLVDKSNRVDELEDEVEWLKKAVKKLALL
jgi:hypothetical protein